ncbi:hypothetical protein [Spirochaeta lutea]|uniref:V-type ATP synthase subunit E n=1 Tax=Spirochaeta lutea TaxID=1480694 RepID=A0A098R180_9SPIO|nr:hypothetical protein [Spirochaeta lutea]KGE73739.1 hypothetical protein DC28_00440 [Spirochaeta lutea]
MEVQLQELLEKIQSEGVEEAKQQAQKILKQAEKEAETIKTQAQRDAEKTVQHAQTQADKIMASGKSALEQAGRDLVLSLEQRIKTLFSQVVEASVTSAYSEQVLTDAIGAVVKAWSTDGTIELSAKQGEQVFSSVKKNLSNQLKDGVTIVPNDKINAGFILREKDGSAYYDFSSAAIAKALTAYLNTNISSLISGNE